MIARGNAIAAQAGSIEATIPAAQIGDGIRVRTAHGEVSGVVVALRAERAIVTLHGAVDGLASGDSVQSDSSALALPLGTMLLGRSVDAQGNPLDRRGSLRGIRVRVSDRVPSPSSRSAIDTPLWTGIRAIDALLTIGRGARIGLFGPPGAGKSTLLHTLVRGAYADAIVIALVGERGREAEEWIRIAPSHATIVCATSDRSAAERIRAANVAMAQAHSLRSRGLHVLLVLDSFARYAAALRETGVLCGESTGRGGYPPSVFAQMARLSEAAGSEHQGSITLVASVLSDGDERDPVSDAARSLLDGHIQLSGQLAGAGHFPAIDLLASASRTMQIVARAGHLTAAAAVRSAVSALARTRDARDLGIMPADAAALRAAASEPAIEAFLRQGSRPSGPAETLSGLAALADTLK